MCACVGIHRTIRAGNVHPDAHTMQRTRKSNPERDGDTHLEEGEIKGDYSPALIRPPPVKVDQKPIHGPKTAAAQVPAAAAAAATKQRPPLSVSTTATPAAGPPEDASSNGREDTAAMMSSSASANRSHVDRRVDSHHQSNGTHKRSRSTSSREVSREPRPSGHTRSLKRESNDEPRHHRHSRRHNDGPDYSDRDYDPHGHSHKRRSSRSDRRRRHSYSEDSSLSDDYRGRSREHQSSSRRRSEKHRRRDRDRERGRDGPRDNDERLSRRRDRERSDYADERYRSSRRPSSKRGYHNRDSEDQRMVSARPDSPKRSRRRLDPPSPHQSLPRSGSDSRGKDHAGKAQHSSLAGNAERINGHDDVAADMDLLLGDSESREEKLIEERRKKRERILSHFGGSKDSVPRAETMSPEADKADLNGTDAGSNAPGTPLSAMELSGVHEKKPTPLKDIRFKTVLNGSGSSLAASAHPSGNGSPASAGQMEASPALGE